MKIIFVKINILPHLALLLLLSGILCGNLFAQSSGPQMIDVFFEYGKADYLDLSGKKVLPAGSTVPQPNLESWVIGYKAWNLIGDFVYNPSFYYAINRERLKGKTRTIEFRTISKYPDLVKRYQAIRPSSVNFIITAELYTGSGNTYKTVNFKVSDNDLIYFESRSAKNFQSPSSPPSGKWKYAFSTIPYADSPDIFTDKDYSDENELRQLLKNASTLRPTQGGEVKVTLKIKWADDAIDEIGRLYDKYEKENKDIDKELNAIKNADKLVKPVAAYNKDDEMSAPFEEEAKSAEVFKQGETVGLRAKGKVVFESADYYSAEPLNTEKSLFKFSTRKGGYHLYNAKGKRLSVDGESDFYTITEGKRPGTYNLYVLLEKKVFTTKQLYSGRQGFLTQSEFDRFVAQDEKPKKAPSDYKEGTVYLTMDSRIDFSRGMLYTVDDKMQVLSRETAYY